MKRGQIDYAKQELSRCEFDTDLFKDQFEELESELSAEVAHQAFRELRAEGNLKMKLSTNIHPLGR